MRFFLFFKLIPASPGFFVCVPFFDCGFGRFILRSEALARGTSIFFMLGVPFPQKATSKPFFTP